MPNFNPEVLDFLSDRHSYPARSLSLPVPDDVLLAKLLTIAARSPDHGKLVPWRFLVLKKPALTRISCMAKLYAQDLGVDAVKTAKAHGQFDFSNLAVVVVSSPREIEKVPLIEQVLSAGAVCIGLANAAQAAGFGACWLSGWVSHEPNFAQSAFGLKPLETISGIVHLGSVTATPPKTARPDIAQITDWLER